MVHIRCDACDRTIEVDQAVIGQKVKCPHCGDINIIRGAGGEARPKSDRAAAAGYPPADGPEVQVLAIRPAMFRARPFRFLLLVAVGLGGVVGLAIAPPPANFIAGGLGAAALLALLVWKLYTLGEGIRITTQRIIDREGFFSRATSEVRFTHIRNVQIRQSFIQRVMGVGTLAISTAAENEDEVSMADVPRPDHVAKVIDLYRPG
jgi:predicted RNA-binding Zn-ribbon protein involved in translation (DUF1610 family)/membrane protein YdbS with pleckstrin-like domain